jgi:hypothetical protein
VKKRHFRDKVRRNKHTNHQPVVKREPSYPSLPERIENALIDGNLAQLTPQERVQLYMQTCKSLKLNPLTKPFGYILVKGWSGDDEKLILYATRNCTDQLRSVYGASDVPGSLKRSESPTELTAEIAVVGRNGRVSTDVGVIPMEQFSRARGKYMLQGRDLANAKMHVVTKARRRATLALYGLGGIVDESELDTMQVVGGVTKEGRIWRYVSQQTPQRELVDGGEPTSELGRRQLEKVERLDKEFASGVATTPMAAPAATASKPTQGTPAGHGEGASPRQPAQGARPAGGSPQASPSQSLSPEGKAILSSAKKLLDEARKPPEERKTLFDGKPQGKQEVPPKQPTTRNPVPQARIPVKVDFVKWTTNGKGLEVTLESGKRLYCFDNRKMGEDGERLQDLLLNGAGKTAIFETKESKAKDGRTFTNITGLVQLGDREWEDGVPVVRREAPTREPGEEGF